MTFEVASTKKYEKDVSIAKKRGLPIDKLVEDGYVTKTLTCDDRRAMCLCITRAGEAALEKWVRCCVFVEEEMLRNFSEEERRQFYHYLDRAYENLNGNEKEVALCEN